MSLEFVAPARVAAFTIDPGTAGTGPRMPAVTARVRLDPTPDGMVTFHWTAIVEYPLLGARCPSQTRRAITHTQQATTTGPEWHISFARVRGGRLALRCEARHNGISLGTASLTGVTILGRNPHRAELHAALRSGVLRQLCAHESGQRQFLAAAFTGTSACPLWSGDGRGGVGLMQITNPRPSDDEVWDWLANIRRGREVFAQKARIARAYPGRVRRTAGFAQLVAGFNRDRQLRGLPAVDVTLPDFTPNELEDDALRGFNGYAGRDPFGLELHEFQVETGATGQLQVDLLPGGVRGVARWVRVTAVEREEQFRRLGRRYPGDPDYVANVRRQNP
jgi:hypothetical protein